MTETRSDDPIKNGFGESRARSRAAKLNLELEDSLPLFLSGPTDDDRPATSDEAREHDFHETGGRTSPVSRGVITMGILAASAVAVACVIFSLQDRDRRAVIAHASASLTPEQMAPVDQPPPTREAISAAFKAEVRNQLQVNPTTTAAPSPDQP